MGKSREQRWWLFHRGKGELRGAVINKRSIGVNWELKV